MDIQELKTLDPSARAALLAKTREELRAARFRISLAEEKKVRVLRDLRRRIARILTVAAAAPKK